MSNNRPIAVLTSDNHFDLKTLKVAASSLRKAIKTAEELDIPLIISGDLHTTKAALRGECVNALVEIFSEARCEINLNIGNHDKIHEKANEHSLNFLEPLCNFIIAEPQKFSFEEDFKFYVIPYYSDVEELRTYLKTIPKDSTLIMHQGLSGSDAGEYFNDRTALNPEDVSDFRVISGHYHRRQDIKTGRPRKGAVGLWSFIGNPYSLDFSEADHPEKGYQILFDDGTLEFVPTNERKHVKLCLEIDQHGLIGGQGADKINPGDIVWVVVYGPSDLLMKVTKDSLGLPQPFRLELVNTEDVNPDENVNSRVDFDSVIDAANMDKDRKLRLKTLWKELLNEDPASQSN